MQETESNHIRGRFSINNKKENVTKMKCGEMFIDCFGSMVYQCLICGCYLRQFDAIQKHFEYHFNAPPYECHLCDMVFNKVALLVEHYKNHESWSEECLGSDSQLPFEVVTIAVNPEVKELDPIAENDFNSDNEEYIQVEMYDTLHGNKGFKKKADNPLHDDTDFKEDSNDTMSEPQREFPRKVAKTKKTTKKKIPDCDLQPSPVQNNDANKNTTETKITKKCNHFCDQCPKGFRDKRDLQRHILSHTGEQPFQCDICHKKFRTYTSHMVHMRVHTDDRPFMCTFCGRRYPSGGQLTVHMRRHTNTRPYTCDVCRKQFFTHDQFKDHERTHTGERPFQCSVCPKSFRAPNALRQHKKLHLDEPSYFCPLCNAGFKQKAGLHNHKKNHEMCKV